ncbi:hypothetical protein BC2230_120116 [Burkholderia cepacia]
MRAPSCRHQAGHRARSLSVRLARGCRRSPRAPRARKRAASRNPEWCPSRAPDSGEISVQLPGTRAVHGQRLGDRSGVIRLQRVASGNQRLAFDVCCRNTRNIRLASGFFFSDDSDLVGDQLADRLAGDFVINVRHLVLQ